MAPTNLETALVDAAHEIFRTDRANLSVNAVRKAVEQRMGLQDGFFKTGDWKAKSKVLITDTATQLLDGVDDKDDVSPTKPVSPEKPSKPSKQEPNEHSEPKHPSRDATPSKSNASSPAEQPSRKRKLVNRKRISESPETKDNERGALEAKNAPDSAENNDDDDHDTKGNASDSSLSSVLDDAQPPPKRKKKVSASATAGRPTAKTDRKSAKPVKSAAASSPAEAEVKKLQSQLVKCGVRKIWAFELKKYGTDAKAKIRHLQSMLRDVGMDGRFSETKAREIKERRELLADLEAVQEMDRNWGAQTSRQAIPRRRAAAAAATSLKESNSDTDDDSETGVKKSGRANKKKVAVNKSKKSKDDDDDNIDDDDDDDGDDDDDDDDNDDDAVPEEDSTEDSDEDGKNSEDEAPKRRAARGRPSARAADLAFLGSESESDSE